jgi:hypothetical protein
MASDMCMCRERPGVGRDSTRTSNGDRSGRSSTEVQGHGLHLVVTGGLSGSVFRSVNHDAELPVKLEQEEVASLLAQRAVSDEWPRSTSDRSTVDRSIKAIVAELRRKISANATDFFTGHPGPVSRKSVISRFDLRASLFTARLWCPARRWSRDPCRTVESAVPPA